MSDSTFTDLRDQFIVATPGLGADIFSGSVSILCEHSADGAMGFIVNRATSVRYSDMFKQLKIPFADGLSDQPLLVGGPVQPQQGFILHDEAMNYESTTKINDWLYVTTSLDILHDIGCGAGPANHIIVLGYAGWGPGQLEDELADNAWLTVPSQHAVVFSTPYKDRAQAALAPLGIDYRLISAHAGHA